MDFIIGLPISINLKSKTYDSILVIIDQLIKIVHYELVKTTINTSSLTKIIIDMVVRHYDLPDPIISDCYSFFNSKFWFLLCYFLGIKKRLSTTFHL